MRITKLTTSAIFGADLKSAQIPEDLFSKKGRQALHECFWSEYGDGLELPVALRPALGDAESLFADAATYFSAFVPITAYLRVLDNDSLKEPLHRFKEISPDLSTHQLRSAIGLAIGELLTASLRNSKSPTESASYGASRWTLSFAVYRSAALHGDLSSDVVVERWLRIREIMKMDSPMEHAASISWIRTLQGKGASPQLGDGPQAAIAETVSGRQSLSWLGGKLAESLGGIRREVEAMRGPFDDRSVAFSQLVQAVTTKLPNGELGAICIAFFCNEILPGSLSHFRLLAPLISAYPTVVIWYGMFASLSEGFDWREAFSGFGLKMARDLLQPFSPGRRPTCDIAFAELEVLSRLPLKADVMKPTHPRACSVELFPGVDVFFRFGNDDDSRAQAGDERQLMEDHARRDGLLRRLLHEALELVPERKLPTPSPALNRSKRLRG
ncbi:hypothetical protein [Rhodoferax sp. BLA1]|uniref:hypothetical protein n=1 Tax=Rhodoferax sp. BLA1 TaxID=2576062 RepID=UPI0015D291E9|nr:hypothetical protein [Rhodoferax sp. BLA1]